MEKKELSERQFNNFKFQVLYKLSAKDIAKLSAELIANAFVWSDSDEGLEYWAEVYDKLYKKSEVKYGKQNQRKHKRNK